MKNFDESPLPIEVREVDEQKKTKFLAQQCFIHGLPFWEFNEKTKVLKEAKIESKTLEYDNSPRKREDGIFVLRTKTTLHRKVVYNPDCFYFQALNQKNALKKIEKLLS